MRLKPSCSWCKDHSKFIENTQLRILLQCYKRLCDFVSSSPAPGRWGSLSAAAAAAAGGGTAAPGATTGLLLPGLLVAPNNNSLATGPSNFSELIQEVLSNLFFCLTVH